MRLIPMFLVRLVDRLTRETDREAEIRLTPPWPPRHTACGQPESWWDAARTAPKEEPMPTEPADLKVTIFTLIKLVEWQALYRDDALVAQDHDCAYEMDERIADDSAEGTVRLIIVDANEEMEELLAEEQSLPPSLATLKSQVSMRGCRFRPRGGLHRLSCYPTRSDA